MPKEPTPGPHYFSPLAQALRAHLVERGLHQFQLARDLNLDPRTLRRYQNGEVLVTDIYELRRIAAQLGIEPEKLGVLTPTDVVLTPEYIDKIIEQVWEHLKATRNYEALALIHSLTSRTSQINTQNQTHLRALAHIYQTAGHVTSITSRTNKIHKALQYYHEMEQVSRHLNDQTLLNIALTYQGDMLRRMGDIEQAVIYLEAARDTTPQASIEARGNSIQLLGRAYLQTKDVKAFEYAMGQTEELAHALDPNMNNTHGFYCPGTVYEEYAKSYGKLGQMQKALNYLDLAKTHLPETRLWEIMLMTSRAIILVQGGEMKTGIEVAVEAATICHESGNYRFLERIYGIQRHIDRLTRELGKAGNDLREALEGPIEEA